MENFAKQTLQQRYALDETSLQRAEKRFAASLPGNAQRPAPGGNYFVWLGSLLGAAAAAVVLWTVLGPDNRAPNRMSASEEGDESAPVAYSFETITIDAVQRVIIDCQSKNLRYELTGTRDKENLLALLPASLQGWTPNPALNDDHHYLLDVDVLVEGRKQNLDLQFSRSGFLYYEDAFYQGQQNVVAGLVDFCLQRRQKQIDKLSAPQRVVALGDILLQVDAVRFTSVNFESVDKTVTDKTAIAEAVAAINTLNFTAPLDCEHDRQIDFELIDNAGKKINFQFSSCCASFSAGAGRGGTLLSSPTAMSEINAVFLFGEELKLALGDTLSAVKQMEIDFYGGSGQWTRTITDRGQINAMLKYFQQPGHKDPCQCDHLLIIVFVGDDGAKVEMGLSDHDCSVGGQYYDVGDGPIKLVRRWVEQDPTTGEGK